MTTAMTKTLARAVLIAGLALPVSALLPTAAPFATSKAYAAAPSTVAEFKSVLAAYGKWGTHDKYGDIWVPTVTPPGWHPYPACQWVYTKQGWSFNDTTPWGSIVHHYGRWQNDEQMGWFWIPDQDWSPGWVAWRQSDQWVGWAPLPPQQDYQLVSSGQFDNDKLWTFMAADKFRNGCSGGGDTVMAAQAYAATYPVTWFGLAPGALTDIDIDQHWTIKNIIKIINIDIDIDIDIDNNCPPPRAPTPINRLSPFHFDNPPKDRRASNDPPSSTGGGNGAQNPPRVAVGSGTPVYLDPGDDTGNPVITVPHRPIRDPGRGGGNGSGSSGWTRPHLSVLTSVGRNIKLNSPSTLRSASFAQAPRTSRIGMGGMGKSTIR